MPREISPDSVGLVEPQKIHISEPLMLSSGRELNGYDLVYETYGTLNQDKTNAILICHALNAACIALIA